MKKASILLILLLFTVCGAFAQDTGVEMATAMRESGKIYVVVGVMTIIFIGIIVYLIMLDRKLSRLERSQRGRN